MKVAFSLLYLYLLFTTGSPQPSSIKHRGCSPSPGEFEFLQLEDQYTVDSKEVEGGSSDHRWTEEDRRRETVLW